MRTRMPSDSATPATPIESGVSLAEAVRRWGAINGGEPRQAAFSGTRGLMAAVLEDGIRAYLDSQGLPREEAEGWVRSRARSWPFAFETVCLALGLEPDAVRTALHRLRARQITGRRVLGRSRSNVYRRGPLG